MSLCVNSFGNCAKCLSHQLTITNGLKSVQRHLVIVSYLAEVESGGTYLDMSLCLCVSLSIVFFIVSLYVWRSLVCMYEDSPPPPNLYWSRRLRAPPMVADGSEVGHCFHRLFLFFLKGLPWHKTQVQSQSHWAKRFTNFGLPTTLPRHLGG